MSDVAAPDVTFAYEGCSYGISKDGNVWSIVNGWHRTDWHNFIKDGEKPNSRIVLRFFDLALHAWNKLKNQKKHPCEVF